MSLNFKKSSPLTARLAAGLALITAAIHTFVGGFDTLAPALQSDLSMMVGGTLKAVWYILGLFLAWSALVFWKGERSSLGLGWVWLASGAIFLVIGALEGGTAGMLELPQWALLIPTGVLAIVSVVYDRALK